MTTEIEAKPPSIHKRVLAVMADVPYVQKVQRKTGLQYTFVNRDAIVSKLRDAMIKHGIVYFPDVIAQEESGNRIKLTVMNSYVNADDSSDCIDFTTVGYGIDPQDKGPGKALTYAEKTAHLKLFMIEAGDEDEAEHYDTPHSTAPPASTKKKAAPPAPDKAAPADVLVLSLADVRNKFSADRERYGIPPADFKKLFADTCGKTEDPAVIQRFLNGIEARYSAWLEVQGAVKKWSIPDGLFDVALEDVQICAPVNRDNWWGYEAKKLEALANRLHEMNDLPFDTKEGE